jgi:hypothetical protein
MNTSNSPDDDPLSTQVEERNEAFMRRVLTQWKRILTPVYPRPLGGEGWVREEGSQRKCQSLYIAVVVGLGLLLGAQVKTAWSIDPVLQLAQQRLIKLGYEIGLPDGIYGPMTRRALQDFQRTQQLPVTGNLDAATLQALERVSVPNRETPVKEADLPDAPLRVVVAFLRAYAYQPSRALPYVSEQFLQGMTMQAWLEKTLQELHEQAFVHLGWQIKHLEMQDRDTRAVVTVSTHARAQGVEQIRQEQFALSKNTAGVWLIDHWQVDVQPPPPPTSTAGS